MKPDLHLVQGDFSYPKFIVSVIFYNNRKRAYSSAVNYCNAPRTVHIRPGNGQFGPNELDEIRQCHAIYLDLSLAVKIHALCLHI